MGTSRLVLSVLVVAFAAGPLWSQTASSAPAYPVEPGNLAVLAGQYRDRGSAGLDDMKALSAHVATKFAADNAAGKVDWDKWLHLVTVTGPHVGAAAQTAMADDLRQKLASKAETTAGLAEAKAIAVANALSAFGKGSQACIVAADWVAGSDKYKTATAGGLAQLGSYITDSSDQCKTARSRLVSLVESRFQADAAAVLAVNAGDWCKFIGTLKGELTVEKKAAWATKLHDAYMSTAGNMAARKPGDVRNIFSLLRGVGDKQTCDVIARAVNSGEAWKTWSNTDQSWLVYALSEGAGDSCKSARASITSFVQSKHLADAAAIDKAGYGYWAEVTPILMKDATAEAKAAWAAKLKEALVTNKQGMANLSAKDFGRITGVLRSLGDKDVGQLTASFLSESNAWQDWKPSEIVLAIESIWYEKGATVTGARQAVLAYVKDKLLASTETAKKIGLLDWKRLQTGLLKVLTPEVKHLWATRVRDAYVTGSGGAFSKGDLQNIVGILYDLGDSSASQLVMEKINAGSDWQSWAPREIAWLAWALRLDSTDANQKARARLGQHIQQRVLPDDAAVESIPLHYWPLLVTFVEPGPGKDQTAWGQRIVKAFAPQQEVLVQLQVGQLRMLVDAVGYLDRKQVPALVSSYLGNADRRAAVGSSQVARLLVTASSGDRAAMKQLMTDLDKEWDAAHSQKSLSWDECQVIAFAWESMGDAARFKKWAMAAYQAAVGSEAARAAADQRMLMVTSYLLEKLGDVGKGQGDASFASALAGLVQKGAVKDDYWMDPLSLAMPLGTKETRKTVEDQLLDAQGNVRLVVAKIMAWAYRKAGQEKDWTKLVDGKIGTASSADQKAMWLVAKGFNESILPQKVEILRAKPHLDKALATAESADAKLAVLCELALYYREMSRPQLAVDMLDSVKQQFQGDQLARLELLQRQMKAEVEIAAARESRAKALGAAAADRSLLRYYQSRLELAQKSGDEAKAARLSRAIADLEAKLQGSAE